MPVTKSMASPKNASKKEKHQIPHQQTKRGMLF